MMSEDQGLAEHVKDLLDAAIGAVKLRQMFGGYGIYHEETMFALIAWGKLYFKADDQSKRHFEEKGLRAFVYDHAGKKPTVMSYWEAPSETLDDPDEIKPWAILGIDADPGYHALGRTQDERARRYSAWVGDAIPEGEWDQIRAAVQRGQLTGTNRFINEVARRVGQRVEFRPQGRPRHEKK